MKKILTLGLEEIQMSEGGRATFWYGDGGMLLGRTFCLTFTPTESGEAADAVARAEG